MPVEAWNMVEARCSSEHEIPDNLPPSMGVVEAVAAAADSSPIELAPLHDAIDPDYLDALFAHEPATQGGDLSLSFRYSGYRVTLDGEVVRLEPASNR